VPIGGRNVGTSRGKYGDLTRREPYCTGKHGETWGKRQIGREKKKIVHGDGKRKGHLNKKKVGSDGTRCESQKKKKGN